MHSERGTNVKKSVAVDTVFREYREIEFNKNVAVDTFCPEKPCPDWLKANFIPRGIILSFTYEFIDSSLIKKIVPRSE